MPAILDEQTQYVDSAGAPLVAGKIYIGTQNADPIANPVSIFSDRALTIALANPQTLDADGRSTNKIWVSGRYSKRVDDVNNVQRFQELDNGEETASGISSLTNVSGSNTITATAVSTITAYVDRELYTFRAVGANTSGVTLNIDGVSAKAVLKNHDKPIDEGDFELNQNIVVSYNSTDDTFEWVNQNAATVSFYEGAAVVAAATTDIWRAGGNNLHVTGATGITSFGTALHVGDVRWVTFDGAPLLSHSANLNLPGAVDYQVAAGDFARIYADTTTQIDVLVFPVSGLPVVVPTVLLRPNFTSSERTVAINTPLNVPHGLGVRPILTEVILRCTTADNNYAVGDEVVMPAAHGSGTNQGVIYVLDATNVSILQGNGIILKNKTTFADFAITVGSWRWVVKAWA